VRCTRADASNVEATIEDANEVGVFLRTADAENEYLLFIPWTAISHIQLLEEPGDWERFYNHEKGI
jgi:hypothetical protein